MMFLGLLASCGSLSADSDSSSSGGGGTTAEPIGGNVSAITIDAGAAQIDFAELSDSEDVVALIYATNELGTASAYEIGGSRALQSIPLAFSLDDKSLLNGPEQFEEMLRSEEASLDPEVFLETDAASKTSKDLSYAVRLGETRTFKILNSLSSSSSYDTITAALRYDGTYFQFYIDERDEDSITEENIQTLGENFEELVPIERELVDGVESDVNDDGKFVVLFTRVVNELGGSSGGIVTGFFYAADLFDDSQYEVSNEMEIFYTLRPDPAGELGSSVTESFLMSNIYPGVLPHEYQHMINFNMHYNVNGGGTETSWLNEALSHLMEDLTHVDDDHYLATSGLENPARVESYLSSIDTVCFTCGTSLAQRGGVYLFLRYLYEQAELGNLAGATDGADLIGRLVNTEERSFDNMIQAAFGDSGTETDFLNELGLFGLAVYLSNTGLSSDDRLNFNGINLRVTQDDNRGTVLNGPSIQTASTLPFTDTLTGTSLSYIQISGETINDNGGSLSLTFGSGSDFGGYIVRE